MAEPAINLNMPVGRVPWTLMTPPSYTPPFQVIVDVEDPVSWDIGAMGSQQGRVTEPLCSLYPVVTTRGNVNGYRGTFTLFIPDSVNRDTVVDSIIAARLDPKIPYFIWKPIDSVIAWAVQFDPEEKITVGYVQGHRVVHVAFVQLSQSLQIPNTVTSTAVVPIGTPTLTVTQSSAYRGETLAVVWNYLPAGTPGDYIGIFPVGAVDNDIASALTTIYLGGALSGSTYIAIPSWATAGQYEIRMVGLAGPTITIGPKIQIYAATLTRNIVPDTGTIPTTYHLSWAWSGFNADDPPIRVKLARYGIWDDADTLGVDVSALSGTATLDTLQSWVSLAGPDPFGVIRPDPSLVPVMRLQGGRDVIGPLS